MKKIKALVSFVYIGENGSITSYAGGQVYEVSNEMASQMISIGYAEEYSEGGGGSSDFSTAEISISATLPGVQCSVTSPHIITNPYDMLVADHKNYSNDDIVTVALYKGKASISASIVGGMGTITVSGDIESMGGGYYLVTGECTITIS